MHTALSVVDVPGTQRLHTGILDELHLLHWRGEEFDRVEVV